MELALTLLVCLVSTTWWIALPGLLHWQGLVSILSGAYLGYQMGYRIGNPRR